MFASGFRGRGVSPCSDRFTDDRAGCVAIIKQTGGEISRKIFPQLFPFINIPFRQSAAMLEAFIPSGVRRFFIMMRRIGGRCVLSEHSNVGMVKNKTNRSLRRYV